MSVNKIVTILGLVVLMGLVLIQLYMQSMQGLTMCVSFDENLMPSQNISQNPTTSAVSDTGLAHRESLGLFSEISNAQWERLREITIHQRRKNYNYDKPPPPEWERGIRVFFQKNWDPDFPCPEDTKIGRADGGKWICAPKRIAEQAAKENRKCIIYSVGSDGNFAFEIELVEWMGVGKCEIHTFDFGDYGGLVPPNKGIYYHRWGLAPSYNETRHTDSVKLKVMTSDDAQKTLQETMRELGHEGKAIDIFKIDCEGCEWKTYKDWLKADLRQILVETHHSPGITNDFFHDLQREGFAMFHKEPNIEFGGGSCIEFAFVKLAKSYVPEESVLPNK